MSNNATRMPFAVRCNLVRTCIRKRRFLTALMLATWALS